MQYDQWHLIESSSFDGIELYVYPIMVIIYSCYYPANTRRWLNVGLMLAFRLRHCWPIFLKSSQCISCKNYRFLTPVFSLCVVELAMDWSDHGLWWPERNMWLSRSRSTLDQYGVQSDAQLLFTPMHKNLQVQLPDLQLVDMRVNFSVNVFAVVIKMCKELSKSLLLHRLLGYERVYMPQSDRYTLSYQRGRHILVIVASLLWFIMYCADSKKSTLKIQRWTKFK